MQLKVLFPITVPIAEDEMKQVSTQYICENLLGIEGWNKVYHSIPAIVKGKVVYKDSTKDGAVIVAGESNDTSKICVDMLKIINADQR